MARFARPALFLLVCTLAFFGSLRSAVADVPDIVSFSANPIVDCGYPLAGRGFLLLVTVRHAGPTASHYVDKIEIIKGKTTETVKLSPQSGDIFTATKVLCEGRDYRTGEQVTVQVRAHCSIHGWGKPSSSITVPELETPSVVALVTLILVVLLTSAHRRFLGSRGTMRPA